MQSEIPQKRHFIPFVSFSDFNYYYFKYVQKAGDILKRICFVLLTAVIMLGPISGSTIAYAKSDVTLIASSVSTEKEAATVSISLKGNIGIWGIKFKVGYDHSALTLSSVDNGNVFSNSDVTIPDTLDKKEFVYFASSNKLNDITTNGTVVKLNFKVVDYTPEGTYPIKVTLTQTINSKGKNVDIDVQGGEVTVVYDIGEDDVVFDKSKDSQLTIPLEAGRKIEEVKIDKTVIEKGDYEVRQNGNVVISSKNVNALKDGKHKVSIVTNEGTTTTDFIVKTDASKGLKDETEEAMTTPATTKSTIKTIVPIVSIVTLGVVAVIVYILIKKRRRMN